MLNAIEDGLVATDREGTIIFSNQAAQRLLGASQGELEGRQMEEVFPESAWCPGGQHRDRRSTTVPA